MAGALTATDATITGTIESSEINGGAFHDIDGHTNLILNPTGTWADLIFERASTGTDVFTIIDNGTAIDLYLGGTHALACGVGDGKVYTYGRWRFDGDRIGFFGATPVVQQTAALIPSPGTATAYDCAIKINGILDKLGDYGLFDIT
jgi:hypothetical protein